MKHEEILVVGISDFVELLFLPSIKRDKRPTHLQGVKGESGKCLSSKFGKKKELVLKQTIPQKKALIFSFNLTP